MGAQWYAIRVKVGRERQVKENLPEMDEIYLPMFERQKVIRGAVVTTGAPAVPGYLFGRMAMSDDAWHAVMDVPMVIGFIGKGHPTPVSDEAIARMRKECDKLIRMTEEVGDLDWMLGKTFRVSEGPWAHQQGACIGFDEKDNPVLIFELFNRMVPVPLPVQVLNLDPINEGETQDFVDANTALRYKGKQSIRRKSRNTPKGKPPGVLLHSSHQPRAGRR